VRVQGGPRQTTRHQIVTGTGKRHLMHAGDPITRRVLKCLKGKMDQGIRLEVIS
jgi:hypothetical protein